MAPQTLSFRQLYIERMFKNGDKIDVGSFTGFSTVGAAGIAPTSEFIEGFKYIHPTKVGNFQVIVGAIDANNPDLFTRDAHLNYVQVEFDREVAKNLMTYTRLDHFNGNNYINEQIEFDPEWLGPGILKLMGEELYETSSGASTYQVGASIDALGAINKKLAGRFTIDGYRYHLDKATHDRNILNAAWFQDGDGYAVRGTYKVNGFCTVYARDSWGKMERIDIGANFKLFGGQFKQTKK